MNVDIVIAGASARAAAFSAIRAGLAPACVDLFGDADLRAVCPFERISTDRYPDDLEALCDRFGAAPWLFTGAIENRVDVIRAISRKRPLWGCSPDVIERVRGPRILHEVVTRAGLCSPKVLLAGESLSPGKHWLIKPVASAAGFGIRESAKNSLVPAGCYAQEFAKGINSSALFVGHEFGALFLGATEQLSGTDWLHAAPFHYAGNLGPLLLERATTEMLRTLGDLLAGRLGLRGIFGVDCVMREGVPWVIEVNPRYTASVEVWEYAMRRSALEFHQKVFEGHDIRGMANFELPDAETKCVGKGIYYSRETVTIPKDRPWPEPGRGMTVGYELPAFADLPGPGDRIERGHPVLTILVEGESAEECRHALEARARELDRWLEG